MKLPMATKLSTRAHNVAVWFLHEVDGQPLDGRGCTAEQLRQAIERHGWRPLYKMPNCGRRTYEALISWCGLSGRAEYDIFQRPSPARRRMGVAFDVKGEIRSVISILSE